MEDLIARELSPDTALFAAVRGVTQADPAAQAEMRRQGVTGRSAGEAHCGVWETAAEMVAAKAAQAAAGEGAVAAGGAAVEASGGAGTPEAHKKKKKMRSVKAKRAAPAA